MLLRFPAWKVILLLGALIIGAVLCLPNVVPKQYLGWLPTGPLNLGLDLKGGASVLLEVDPNELRANELNNVSRAIRDKLREAPLIPVNLDGRKIVGDHLEVRVNNTADVQAAADRIKALGKPALGQIGATNSYDVTVRPDNVIEVRFSPQAFQKLQNDALSSSMEAVRRRADNSGLVEPNIQKQGDSRIIVEVPGLDPKEMEKLVDTLTKAGVLTFNLVDVAASATDYEPGVPKNGRVALPDDSRNGQLDVIYTDPIINGSDLATASQSFDETGRPNISFRLHPGGATKFGKATAANVNKPFAIVLDNRIVSAPNIESPIMTGSGMIRGNFTIESAEQMAIILRSGALPAKLRSAEQRVVDASLGADSIHAGVTASFVGVGLVAVFMIAAYGPLGLFAVAALICNAWMLVGVLSGFGATLTLPGIAGILLTMGMAVDYNVLIFERIREEKKAGRSPITSVEAGYEHAMATIIDANVTHLVAALVMFNLGSGPVKGFALTLALGVLTSIFTAVIVARWMMAIWLKIARPKWIPI
ncbi:MAG TPA: protein translocase subunit SecD [Hyphomonadaceae bacterium]|nr:protein translocase subunit SecD [Hyphomonadaceae bacterium]